ncbi:hypothetical protein LTSEMON_1672 [Salmonella enterica subsp. enterica serovar Montevideo str. S5-403]|uniref:Integrase n=1 Tax=Salmonella enterica subsp. enterica serovar Montevideo str. S5-403 TaxID=913242 RepID=G5Q1E9_SALMO|nr:hypothetical protein LTSEMON_1672 [Salmonella enterica subsp. enterica serovar Montevideo str. S5-403]
MITHRHFTRSTKLYLDESENTTKLYLDERDNKAYVML